MSAHTLVEKSITVTVDPTQCESLCDAVGILLRKIYPIAKPEYLPFTALHRDLLIQEINTFYDLQRVRGIFYERIPASPEESLEAYVITEILVGDFSPNSEEDHANRMKSMPYVDFLQTPYWRLIRRVVLDRDGHQCVSCTSTFDLNVHHRTYEHRGREHDHLEDLTVLCNICHAKFHNKPTPEGATHA